MDYSKLPKLNLKAMAAAIALGIIVAVALYQAQIRGLIPSGLSQRLPQPGISETRTIVSEENAVTAAVEKTSPGVVAIGATQRVFNPFDPFSLPRSQSSTVGTGFVVSKKGVIVTNKHVVSETNTRYTVVTRDGKKFEIRKIYRDPILDLAVVQVDGEDMQTLELGDSSKIKVGQTVIAIGNALGRFTNTVTTGVVSGLGRRVVAGDPFTGAETLDDLIQTDAAINPGNSGGPLLNSAGQVIGVNVATTEGAQNIGFAVPINSVKKIVEEFVQTGSVSRPFLGIRYRFISKDVAILNEVPQGAFIQEVVIGSSADKAGIKEGDIITKMDNQEVDSEGKISQTIAGKSMGDSLNLTVWNDGKERSIKATLQEAPSQ
ncbi:trypsin-like peptidase domain-containing protein [Candidatus Daviesbacteria bacterium]|nr:trypsin-like peptidase domain-containing protein [Candidatus Daviesbacteria bacterium]